MVIAPDGAVSTRRVVSQVGFKRLSETRSPPISRTGEWRGKAGGYAIQGRAAALIAWMAGSYSNVVGLPLFETAQLLAGQGYRRLAPRAADRRRPRRVARRAGRGRRGRRALSSSAATASRAGSIHLGRVVRVAKGLDSAFVDIGDARPGLVPRREAGRRHCPG